MIETIISNNCVGGAVAHYLGLQFKSPVVNCKIMPDEYPKFCANLRKYMEADLREYTDISDIHEYYLDKMWGYIPSFPLGIIDDIMVVFQHYSSFAEGSRKWNERKKRVDYDHIGFLFHINDVRYIYKASEFMELKLPNSIVITEGFVMPGAVHFHPQKDEYAFTIKNGHPLFIDAMDFKSWRENG